MPFSKSQQGKHISIFEGETFENFRFDEKSGKITGDIHKHF